MEVDPPEWFSKCPCGKSFYQPNSYSNHVKSCSRYKQNAGNVLDNAKARYAKKEKRRKGKEAVAVWYGEGGAALDVDQDLVMAEPPEPEAQDNLPAQPMPTGRGLRVRAPPQMYQDFLATSAIPFEIPMFGHASASPPSSPSPGSSNVPPSIPSEKRSHILQASQWRQTRHNGFALYKSYWSLETRPHDPDLFLSNQLEEDSDPRSAPLPSLDKPPETETNDENPFHPFPNWSSYRLGEWYWRDGEKSRQSFQQLLNIITDEDFVPGDVRIANWKKINDALASSEFEEDLSSEDAQWVDDGTSWKTTSVVIDVPFNSTSDTPGVKPYIFEDFRYRPLIPIILAKLQDKSAMEHFHIVPSKLWWGGGEGGSVRVHGDLYHSDAFLDAYREVQLLPPEDHEDHLPRYVVALMFASDETHLTSFGGAQLWPAYMHFGNEPKDRRGKTSLKLFEEVAYFQKLSDSFNDWYLEHSGKNTVAEEILRHLRRELFHAQWGVLLDDDFVQAYEHGLIVDCPDKVRRRFYPRIMTYAADYPERQKVVGVRATGGCPCARCLVLLPEIPQMGTTADKDLRISKRRVDDIATRKKVERARKFIFGGKNYAVDSAKVEELLKPSSLVPSKNGFSERLSSFGFDVYDIPAVDILHEVEIGVWKSLFIQLIRLLEALPGTGQTGILNNRYRQIPTFGRDTIRRFRHDVSAMRQLGARDFEDLLQCSLPAFEGLFPDDHDSRVQDLLFTMAHWHALAKLKMHTDHSLQALDSWTSLLGESARAFVVYTCSQFKTRELKTEYEARRRKEARASTGKKGKKQKSADLGGSSPPALQYSLAVKPKPQSGARGDSEATSSSIRSAERQAQPSGLATAVHQDHRGDAEVLNLDDTSAPNPGTSGSNAAQSQPNSDGRKFRTWSLSTPKYHSLGHVVGYIRRAGTTDSYSTQLSERYHRFPKSRYRRTNKKDVPRQLSRIQTRQSRIKKLRSQLYPSAEETGLGRLSARFDTSNPTYFIGKSQNRPVNIAHFLRLNANDPATKDFLVKLKHHLFPRIIALLTQEVLDDPTRFPEECHGVLEKLALSKPDERDVDSIYFYSDSIYRHNILQVPYTTYNCHQDVDTINPHTTRRDVMCLLAPGSPLLGGHDYTYGRVMGIYHANVVYGGSGCLDYRRRRLDFLWVRWYTPVPDQGDTWTSKRLFRLKLAPMNAPGSWDFVDPSFILRRAHIIPRFSQGPLYSKEDQRKRTFSKAAQDHLDWQEYYVNQFVDRDMVMRFHRGMAVGHPKPQVGAPHPIFTNTPMDMDPLDDSFHLDLLQGVSDASDDESLSDSPEEASDISVSDIPEPDSEEEPDIYG